MKKTALHVCAVMVMLSAAACNNTKTDSSTTTTTDTAILTENNTSNESGNMADRVEDAFNGNQDSNFLAKALVSNNEDMQLLQAGIDKGTNSDLKMQAKMMQKDHNKIIDGLKTTGTRLSYPLPVTDDGDAMKIMDKLNNKDKGNDWDKKWVDEVVDKHEKEIKTFERAENDVKDPQIKEMIVATLPTLRSHLEMAKGLQDKMN